MSFAKELSSLLSVVDGCTQSGTRREAVRRAVRQAGLPSGAPPPVAEFVLTRAPERSIQVCLDMLGGAVDAADEAVEHVAVALLRRRAREAWHVLQGFLRSAPEGTQDSGPRRSQE